MENAMQIEKLKNFLDEHQVKYKNIQHSPAYTAQEIAESAHIPGKEVAKTVIVKLDGQMAMAVVPASYQLNFDLLKKAAGAKTAELANEAEFKNIFPDCEVGAMPPFGNLYGLPVFISNILSEDEQIVFNSGNHAELTKMNFSDFERLVSPVRTVLC